MTLSFFLKFIKTKNYVKSLPTFTSITLGTYLKCDIGKYNLIISRCCKLYSLILLSINTTSGTLMPHILFFCLNWRTIFENIILEKQNSMNISTLNQTEAWIIALLLFILMLISSFIGNEIGNYIRNKKDVINKPTETSGLLALLFFLLAFTFGMSGDRYDSRRKIVIEEANDIGTAILQSD